VREEAHEHRYRITMPVRGPAVLTRQAQGRAAEELARSGSWTALARVMLGDALEDPPAGKLARDLGRFLVVARGAELHMSGEDLRGWLDTWRPPLSTIFGDRLRRR